MSYLRYGTKYTFVEGESADFIFPTVDPVDSKRYIEDYGYISDKSLVELIARYLATDYPEFKYYLVKKLAKRLKVKLK